MCETSVVVGGVRCVDGEGNIQGGRSEGADPMRFDARGPIRGADPRRPIREGYSKGAHAGEAM